MCLLSDRLLSEFPSSILRAQVVEVWGPMRFSSLPECSRVEEQRMNLKQRLTQKPSQIIRASRQQLADLHLVCS